VLIDLDTEGERELLSDALIAESWVATFHLEDGLDQLGRRAPPRQNCCRLDRN
jgi:hypothetical protein